MTAQSIDDQPTPKDVLPATGDSEAAEGDRFFQVLRHKAEALVASGLREGHARNLAQLEMRIAEWPPGWGDNLMVLIYGDFSAPTVELDFPDLGISIEADKISNSVITSAICVLKARVKIAEKSVEAVLDAAARINVLLGVLAVLNWGNSGIGWWSRVTHGSMGGVVPILDPDRVRRVVDVLQTLPPHVGRKIRSALYWIREPRQLLREGYRSDVLRVYAGYWNAFECLVEAVCLLRPQPKIGRVQKQKNIDAFVAKRNGKLDPTAISECYRTFVDPGFVVKASHALGVCFPERADQYVIECFQIKPDNDRLYNIRNAINHGDVDADDLSELLRVEDRYSRLWMIVFGMLGLLLPIDGPLDQY
jgi:hypothetical protein